MAITGRPIATLSVSLIVDDVKAAADFYRDVLGAAEIRRSIAPSNHLDDLAARRPSFAELRIGDACLTLTQENPRLPAASHELRSPRSAGASSVALTLYVDDVDAVLARALAAGASPHRGIGAPQDSHWGNRVVQLWDPFGHFWRIQTRLEDVAEEDLAGREAALHRAHRPAATTPLS